MNPARQAGQPGHTAPRAGRLLLAALGLAVLARLVSLGLTPLADSTEARYADIGRRMVALGDWVTPWFADGVPFWGKPPLYTWMTAAGFEVFGLNEFAARVPHFLAGVFILWLVWDWLRGHGRREALLAVALLWGAALFLVSAGAVMTDMALLVGLVLAMRGFWRALHEPDAAVARREGWLLFVGLGIGLLAKGPLVLVLAGMPLVAWTLATRRLAAAWRAVPWLGGLVLMLAIAAPWYLLAEARTPGFLDYFLVGEHWKRFTVPGWAGDRYGNAHAEPRGMVWVFLVGACLPWSVLLPVLAWGRRSQASEPGPASPASAPTGGPGMPGWTPYLLLWGLWPCLFFTASRNIIWTYVLPGLPALAMLAGCWLARDTRTRRTDALVAAGLAMSVLALVGILGSLELRGESKSARAVVAAFEARRAPGDVLLFVGRNQFSASFYTRGQARPLDDFQALQAVIAQPAAGPGVRYVALRRWDDRQPDAALRARLRSLGNFQGYELTVVNP
ncbi:MAG: ArnT family glycosyltransferase [Rubrivivax sp.]